MKKRARLNTKKKNKEISKWNDNQHKMKVTEEDKTHPNKGQKAHGGTNHLVIEQLDLK